MATVCREPQHSWLKGVIGSLIAGIALVVIQRGLAPDNSVAALAEEEEEKL